MTVSEGSNNEGSMAALDRYVAPGLRLWMLIALVLRQVGRKYVDEFCEEQLSGVSVVIVCCFMRIRIPRTKRQIDLIAARRKMRKSVLSVEHSPDGKAQPIVMNTAKQHQKGGNRREHEDDTTESAPLVHKLVSAIGRNSGLVRSIVFAQ
ncbi:unnamed protein product [Litomosoides sigmodontis]|uniref:Uncharacterized protein n=1 Tax=Litomosoides sigmodontis TaxID=42156 RepID=A0A3P6TL41_LITSI|nr:unnamed protein product [Litomosoides sigmodontis]